MQQHGVNYTIYNSLQSQLQPLGQHYTLVYIDSHIEPNPFTDKLHRLDTSLKPHSTWHRLHI